MCALEREREEEEWAVWRNNNRAPQKISNYHCDSWEKRRKVYRELLNRLIMQSILNFYCADKFRFPNNALLRISAMPAKSTELSWRTLWEILIAGFFCQPSLTFTACGLWLSRTHAHSQTIESTIHMLMLLPLFNTYTHTQTRLQERMFSVTKRFL